MVVTGRASRQNFTDSYGWSPEFTPMDEMRFVEPYRLVGATFVGDVIDTAFWTVNNTAGGTTVQTGGQTVLATNTTASGATTLQTVAKARYTGGSSNRFRAQIRLGDSGVANNVRRWGAFDGVNGAYFKLDGTALYTCNLRNSSEATVVSTEWNNDKTYPALTSVQTYEIYYTNAKVYYVIAGSLKHTLTATSSTWTHSMNLPVRLDNTNTTINTNQELTCRVATIYRMGAAHTSPKYFNTTTSGISVLKRGAGMLHRVVMNDPTNTLTYIYDSVTGTGTVTAKINPDSSSTPFVLEYMVPFNDGLSVNNAGTSDLTVIYE